MLERSINGILVILVVMLMLALSSNVYSQKGGSKSGGSGKAGDVGPGSFGRNDPPAPGGRVFGRPSWNTTPGVLDGPRAPVRNPPSPSKSPKKAPIVPVPATSASAADRKPVQIVPGPDPAVPVPPLAKTPPADQKPVPMVPGPDPAVPASESPRAPVRNPPVLTKKAVKEPLKKEARPEPSPGPIPLVVPPSSKPSAPVVIVTDKYPRPSSS
jgi:hypothetical protein